MDSPHLRAGQGWACQGRSRVAVGGDLLWLLRSHLWFMLPAQAEARRGEIKVVLTGPSLWLHCVPRSPSSCPYSGQLLHVCLQDC